MSTKIVVAETSKTVRRMVQASLARHPFELQFADDAASALTLVQGGGVGAVIVAGNLPGDGYEAAASIKADAAGRDARIVMLIGRNQGRYDAARGGRAGVDQHLTKPFLTQQLVESVFKALGRPAPDGTLFKTSTLNIPLARKPDPKPEPKPAPPPLAKPTPPAPPMAKPTPPPLARPKPPAAAPTPAAAPSPFEVDGPTAQFKRPAELDAPLEDQATPVAKGPSEAVVAAAASAAASITGNADLAAALSGASAEIVERVAWEVIPALAEAILKEEIARVVRERMAL
jgi:CheY-like chemotaxis protein